MPNCEAAARGDDRRARRGDGGFGAGVDIDGLGAGFWDGLPVNRPGGVAQEMLRRLMIRDGSMFRTRGPEPDERTGYAEELNEVKRSAGSRATRTEEQIDAAKSWGDVERRRTWSALMRDIVNREHCRRRERPASTRSHT